MSVLAQSSARSYQEELLRGVDELRSKNTLCDMTIVVGNKEFRVHKIILVAGSPFFRGLFTNDMKEARSASIALEKVSVSIMEDLLRFMYTGEVELTNQNVQELLVAADYLLIANLKEICCEYLQDSLSPATCFSTARFAHRYCSEKLQDAADQFTRDHFVEASKSEEFVYLDHNTVIELISNDDIVVTQEEEVYEAVLRWVEHDYRVRKEHFDELFNCVRLNCIGNNYLHCIQHERAVVESLHSTERLRQALMTGSLRVTGNRRKSLSQDDRLFVCCGGYKAMRGDYNSIYHWSPKGPYDMCKCSTNIHSDDYGHICG